jgi:hypothetical protein
MSDALDLLAALVLEDGSRWGDAAVRLQWEDARAVLDPSSQTPLHWLGRARGYSKTTDLGAMAIAAMLAQAPGRSRLYGLAADQAQGGILLDGIAGFASRTPELHDALVIQESKVIAQRSGSTLSILPADSASIWGLRPWFAVVDEVSQWHDSARTRKVWEGLTTGLAKVQGSRLAVICTAGDPSHWSKKIRDAALDDPLWRVHDVEGPPPWLDEKRLAGEKRRLPESSYLRLFENQWTASDDRLASSEDIAACVTLDGPQAPIAGRRYVCGLDIGLKHDRTVAAICHSEPLPGSEAGVRIVLDRMETWTPSRLRAVQLSTVEAWLEEMCRRYNGALVHYDPSQAIGSVQRLSRRGIRSKEFTFGSGSVGRLAITLLQLIRERALALPDDEALTDELLNVRLRESSPGVYRLDHDRDKHDDRAIALALAASWLVEHATSGQEITVSHPFLDERRALKAHLVSLQTLPTEFDSDLFEMRGYKIFARDPDNPPAPPSDFYYIGVGRTKWIDRRDHGEGTETLPKPPSYYEDLEPGWIPPRLRDEAAA